MSYRHIEQAVFDSPWAIVPSKMEAICEALEARVFAGSEARDLSAFEAAGPDEPYTTAEGVRVIPVRGVMAKRMNMFMQFSGGASTEIVQSQIEEALSASGVRAIMLDIDSHGGSVDGSFTLAEMVHAARGIKPIVAFADGHCMSASYLLASAANQVIANDTAQVGSIGVVMTHLDRTGADAKAGYKRTVIHAGKYKAMGSDALPLDVESQTYLQESVDAVYGLFVDRVARNRGASSARVLQDMADGRIFLGRDALGRGLIDRIGERGDALRVAVQMAEERREGRIMKRTVMENLGLVLEGRAEEIEGDEDRANAEAIVERVSIGLDAKRAAAAVAAVSAVEPSGEPGETEVAAVPVEAVASLEAGPEPIDEGAIVATERARVLGIQQCCLALGIDASAGEPLIEGQVSLEAARSVLIEKGAEAQKALRAGGAGRGMPENPDGRLSEEKAAEAAMRKQIAALKQ